VQAFFATLHNAFIEAFNTRVENTLTTEPVTK
jgi:hypothetical protein